MKIVYNIALLLLLPILSFSQEIGIDRQQDRKPDINEFSQSTSILQSFPFSTEKDDVDPRIEYMYQSTPFQQSIDMSQIASQQNRSNEWYKSNENPETFAKRQQQQINDAVKVFSQDSDKTIQLKVEENYQAPQSFSYGRFDPGYNRVNPYYRQRNVKLMIDLSKD